MRPVELLVGKMLPYLVLTAGVLRDRLADANGFPGAHPRNFLTLLMLALPFVLTMLGIGLLISLRPAPARRPCR